MNWNSPAEFFSMGGNGFFVWGSYIVCALCMGIEPVLAARRRRRALREAADERNRTGSRGHEDGHVEDEEDGR
jgi:heme exporter protein D